MKPEQVVISDNVSAGFQPNFRGFRKRWISRAQDHDNAGASEASPGARSVGHSGCSWDFVDDMLRDENFSDPAMLGTGAGFSSDGFGDLNYSPTTVEKTPKTHPRIRDPAGYEASWRQAAFEATTKRARLNIPKMPWEEAEVSAVFGAGNIWDGSIVAGYEKFMAPQALGIHDVLESDVVHSTSSGLGRQPDSTPVIRLVLSGSRKESTDLSSQISCINSSSSSSH